MGNSMTESTSNPFSIKIRPPASGLLASFQLSAATGGADLPFTLGQAFRKGDVPAGAQLVGSIPKLQVVVKNAWPDGSLKFAVVSGQATLAAGVPQTVTLGRGAPAARTPLGTEQLRATGISAALTAGSYGQAVWSGPDWNLPFLAWISGPEMSSWIYRKPIGSDAHLVAWLEVRLYAGGAVEVLPWIENGYIKVPAPSNRSAVYTFSLGASERFRAEIDLPHHCRTVLIEGSALSHWLGDAPTVAVRHDKAYLQASRLVPAYRAQVPSSAKPLTTLVQSYVPLQRGNYSPAMGQAGYQPPIGLLPEWDVLYLASDDPRAYAGVIINAYSAGRYGIHYRDENTLRPLRFSSYPNLVVNGGGSVGISGTGASTKNTFTPLTSGTGPATWDVSHHPAMGFTAYLLTGRFYFMEEVQFTATLNFLKISDRPRQFSDGVFQSSTANTTRGAGWALRTLAQAACVTPDDDTVLRGEFLASFGANVGFYHGTYVAQPNNPYGNVAPYSNYTRGEGKFSEAAWMQDFFTASVGYALDIVPTLPGDGSAKLAAFFAWKARSIVGRLGGLADNEYLYRDAALYTNVIAPADEVDFLGGTGPWFASWGDMYAASVGVRNPGEAGPLRGGYIPAASSYWANLQPAIAYAVQHQVPGALEAYQRMTGASNWPDLVKNFHTLPVWSVMPH